MTDHDKPLTVWRGLAIAVALAVPLWAGIGLVCWSLWMMFDTIFGG